MKAALQVASVVLVALAVAGCRASGGDYSDWPLALRPAFEGSDDGGLQGQLVLDDPCLYLEEPSGARWLLVFEYPGTEWDDDAGAVETGGERLLIGSTVIVGGGEVGSHPADLSHIDLIREPDPACDLQNVWLVDSV